MGFISEFKDFAMKGNVMDLAVGVIIGGAFGKIVTSLVENVLMPIIGVVSGGADFTKMAYTLGSKEVTAEDGTVTTETVDLAYGAFIQSVFDFLIIALCIFLMVKMINKARIAIEGQPEPGKPAEDPADIALLKEIRDSLKK